MTDAEKLLEIEKALEPVYKWCKPGAAVPQNSNTFIAILSALRTISEVVPDSERMVTVRASEYEALLRFKAAATVPGRA